jgi:hypothetical protein
MRGNLIPQCLGSKYFHPAAVAFLCGSNHQIHKIIGSTVACAIVCFPNDGGQSIRIPHLRPSRHGYPRRMGIKALDPQAHAIKHGLRDSLIPQCWGSPAAVALASF